MARRKRGEAPQMRHHKASGRAYVTIHGCQHYLGPWGSAESRRAYKDIVSRWESANRPSAAPLPVGPVRVAELASMFGQWADRQYRRADGSATGEAAGCRFAISALLANHADQLADDISGRDLREILSSWRAAGHVRTTCNTYLGRVKRMFRWGAKNDLISPATWARIQLVDSLRHGEAIENAEVEPVSLRDLVKTLRHLSPMIAAMVRLQYYCGARPGEVCEMRRDEIRRGSFRVGGKTVKVPPGLAVFLPRQHKTIGKGQLVFYTLGPRAQACVEGGGEWVFQRIDYSTYALAVSKAAATAGAAHWSPNQLRHNFLTRWDSLAGIEAASAAVRHKSLATTAIYVQRDLKVVGELAAKFG